MAILFKFPPRATENPASAEPSTACIGNTVLFFPGVRHDEAPEKPAQRPLSARDQRAAKDYRLAMLSKIHIALNGNKKNNTVGLYQRLEGFTEDVYRYALEDRFGKRSAADLTEDELHQTLLWLSSLGFQAKRSRQGAPKTLKRDETGQGRAPRMEKIEAFLAEKGRVEGTDMPWGYAVSILKRQTANAPDGPVKSFEKASPEQLDDVIAALYRDAKRKGRRTR